MSSDEQSDLQDLVTVAYEPGVGIITMNRPAQRNALDSTMLLALAAAMHDCVAAPDVRCIVLTGGADVFAAGADLREMASTTPTGLLTSPKDAAWREVFACPLPVVAAVGGYALGGGCELALSADIVVAADNSVFGQPEVRLGIMPGAGGTQRWARSAGRYTAAALMLTGRTMNGWDALGCGIASEVVPAERVVAAGRAVADRIARFGALSTRSIKTAIRASESLSVDDAMRYEKTLLGTLLSTEDAAEGISAFLERRRPAFRGL